jgi:uncharacterized membrane protein
MTQAADRSTRDRALPSVRMGVLAGTTALLCCVGPTLLALLGIVSASTAFVWATDLYDGYAWWFRLAGLVLLAVLATIALRRRAQCTLGGVRSNWRRLAMALAVAVVTYIALYAATTWLGTLT